MFTSSPTSRFSTGILTQLFHPSLMTASTILSRSRMVTTEPRIV